MNRNLHVYTVGCKQSGARSARRYPSFILVALTSFILLFGGVRKTEAQDKGLTPTVNCVQVRPESGKITAYFGYVAIKDVTAKPGTVANTFFPPPDTRGQDSKFLAGVHQLAYAVTFDLNLTPSIAWSLDGTRVTAGPSSPRCDVNDPDEQLQFGPVNYLVKERDGSVDVTVVRSNSTQSAVSVDYSTANGTATSGSDYVATSGTLNFAAGETSKTFTIPILSDGQLEQKESVLLRLSNPTGGTKIGPSNLAVLIIEDRNHFTNRSGTRFDSREINVNGLTGIITRVRVTLDEFVSRTPNTADVLLVSPTGEKMLLMSDAGASSFLNQQSILPAFAGTLIFDDSAASLLPSGLAFNPGTYKPTNYGGGDILKAPAPSAPYQSPAPAGTATLASTFSGNDPNGTWRLFIQNSDGEIINGWSLTIETVECAEIVLNPDVLPTATSGSAYSTKLTASGGTAPYTFTIKDNNALPIGISLSSNGTFSGTANEAGSFPLTVQATDANGCSGRRVYTLTVGQGETRISPSVIPGGAVGLPFATAFTVTNGTAPFTFNLSGTLPTGLNFSGVTLSGTPTVGGAFPITVSVKDANGSQASANYTLTINRSPSLSGVSSMPATWNKLLTFTAVAKDLDVPQQALSFSLVNAPIGASINPTTGVFSWTPTGPQLGAFTFTVKVTDNGTPSLSASQVITITVDAGATTLSITNIIPGTIASTVLASALVTNAGNDSPLKNRLINFKIGGASVNATTDQAGAANATLILPEQAGPYTLITTLEGDEFVEPSTAITGFNITQAGNCTHLIFPTSQSFDERGGTGRIDVNSSKRNCRWSAASDVRWIETIVDSNGVGNGKRSFASFAVAANPNLIPRTGTLNIAGMTVAILQDAVHLDIYNELRSIRSDLETLGATVADKRDRRKLDDAVQHLSSALDPTLWLDHTHLQVGANEKVFKQGKKAAGSLIDLLRDKKSTVSDEFLLTLIHRIVRAMRALVLTSITDIPNQDSGQQAGNAQQEIRNGDMDVAGGRFLSGIDYFGNGWKLAFARD